ncbi:hypothetical protein R3X27_16865 [Tropicimonas sp. TH_r6]|uniref:hypothetical protein n=1 Tax=Tropicimonas sp. TH_r6 TaxID=3082085 RepID=UPI0029533F36|nr:hypothetical protein [Tropicimonas sp. TH_r6]MDV7144355.1 hypothetical protein [Tropicimonas sp. TH_r6]
METEIRRRVSELARTLDLPPRQGAAPAERARQELGRAVRALRGGGIASPDFVSARRLRSWAESWPRIDALLAAQLPPRAQPLFEEGGEGFAGHASRAGMVDEMFGALHHVLSPAQQDPAMQAAGSFSDLSFSQWRFMTNLQAALRVLRAQGRHAGTRFLDVGCGAGLKLLSAAPFFDRSEGLEFDPGHARAGRALLARAPYGNLALQETDATCFKDYKSYDVIYLFRPLRHPEKLAALEDRIVLQARPGVLLIAPYPQFALRAEGLGCARIGGDLYLAHADAAEAAALVARAEFIGLSVKAEAGLPLPALWAPILEASRRRGFLPGA